MLRFSLRSLLARKLRLALSALAVVLGVAFVSGTFVLTDTLGRVFDDLFAGVNEGTAVTVRGVSALGETSLDSRPPVDAGVVERVRAVEGVAEAVGRITGYAELVVDGTAVGAGGAPTLGVDIQPDSRLETLSLREGRAPSGDGEIAVDKATADREGIAVGDRVQVAVRDGLVDVTVTGSVGFGAADSFGGATLAVFDLPTAQDRLGLPGTFSEVAVAALDGVDDDVLARRVDAALPDTAEAVTGAQSGAETSAEIKEGLGFFTTALLVFAGISLFVGAFLIFNTFSMLVAQRARELALLRALGASRRQVTGSVLVEALVIGLVASIAGFVLGIGVAAGLEALLGAVGIDLPQGDLVLAPRTLVACLVVGLGVTAVAALVPARRAAKVAPVEAMRDSGPAEERSLRRRGLAGTALLGAGVGALGAGLASGTLELVGLGAAVTFLGVATLSPLVARQVAGVLAAPFARLGVPGRLGRANAVRSPRRTSATAAALMVGLALVSAVSVLGASLKESVVGVVDRSLGADYVLTSSSFQGFAPAVADRLRATPEIDGVLAFRFAGAEVDGRRGAVSGVDPDAAVRVLGLEVVDGDLGAVEDGAIALSTDVADELGLGVGDRAEVTWARTGTSTLEVGALYEPNQFLNEYAVSEQAVVDGTTSQLLGAVLLTVDDGVSSDAARAAVERGVGDLPTVQIEDRAEFVASQSAQVDQLLNAITVLLVLSVVIAVLGIVNTLALSVVERTRELGLLRAVGLQRRQLRRMIRIESVVIALYGALLGLVVGTAFGWALVRALEEQGVTEFALPVGRLALVVVAAGLAGVLAAALPARRAARLDVLAAVATT
jgi:putative ABC transport system permease protein